MKQNLDGFVVESTPVLDIKKQSLGTSTATSSTATSNWDSDRTEVYADVDAAEAIASLVADNGETYPITTFPFVMGRGNECDLVLSGKGVSRRHAEIVFQSGRFVVNDLESLNGIKVNGYKIARVILEENDVIKLGEVTLTFYSGGKQEEEEAQPAAKSSAGLFTKKERAKPEVDDTFGPSPLKKMLTTTLMLFAVLMLLATGYLYVNKNSSSGLVISDGVSVKTPEAPASVKSASSSASPASSSAQPTSESPTAPTSSSQSDLSTAPPPSLSLSAKKPAVEAPAVTKSTAAEPKVADIDALIAKPAPKPASPPVSKPKPKPVANLNNEALSAKSTAERLYLQGNASGALAQLRPYLNNSAVSGAARTSVIATNQDISSLYDQFEQAQTSFQQGDKDLAFSMWTDFMSREAKLFSGQKSSYSRSITTRVVDEYVARGNAASENKDYHSAYDNWEKALQIGDSVAAKIAIENQTNRARQLYRQALRLEYVNADKAKAMWHEVTQLLPPGTEYHTKASAKLAWYDKWGT